ncbi:TIGR03862 family flavoprotein [Neorhizobium lilium]|uniref:TIGR03862 family flavoprotein n=1 Tax=Neorhizobium lilium TaxID=2503024 RepID=A0A3S3VKI6_9HYPH|nr:TIGR03862 family flavoprotein [Neorhizobium lilium]RWX76546.1 TIGR03862 family flavoprotein [Neorhizobium lilium]
MAQRDIAIIGGGPAGLMAAEVLATAGYTVTVYEQMPTVGRKFLLAGKSGLNITHSEDFAQFAQRFGASSPKLQQALEDFTPDDIRAWAAGLGTETFVGTSGRVFPTAMKASPLLRAWLRRLETQGVRIKTRHRWLGFDPDGHRFHTPEGEIMVQPDAALLALGGASWPRLGSDGTWTEILAEKHISVSPLKPANCGFDVAWSEPFRQRFSGEPVKSVAATSTAGRFQGEFVISRHGIEGSLVYAHSAALRDQLEQEGHAALILDLAPGRDASRLARDLARQDAKASFANRLRKGAGIDGVKAAVIRETHRQANMLSPDALAHLIKTLPIPLLRPRPIEEAISSAGGIAWSELTGDYMLKTSPGLFVAGEMVDWEAPTGGYLLTACLAMGRTAAKGIDSWFSRR